MPTTAAAASTLYEMLLKNGTEELANNSILGNDDADDEDVKDDDDNSSNSNSANIVAMDWYKNLGIDYRGFIFVIHAKHGLLMLHCTRKKSKPPHYQCPGGHIDDIEFQNATKQVMMKDDSEIPETKPISPSDEQKQRIIFLACRAGAARELYEETSIDIRNNLNERLLPVVLHSSNNKKKTASALPNGHKDRFFFVLQVNDDDFYTTNTSGIGGGGGGIIQRAQGEIGKELMLKLSNEHSGFKFEPNPKIAIESLRLHSGGKVSAALSKGLEV